jgi:hypothetical protein
VFGWVRVVPPELWDRFYEARLAFDFFTPTLYQRALAEFLRGAILPDTFGACGARTWNDAMPCFAAWRGTAVTF